MNGVLVKMANGDNETFKTATSFDMHYEVYDGANAASSKWLRVLQDDLELGIFPPGSWLGVRYFEDYARYDAFRREVRGEGEEAA